MRTKQEYIDDSYLQEMDAEILEVTAESDGRYRLVLSNTVFYPMGGGQATDQGSLESSDWKAEVYQVMYKDGDIWHFVKCESTPSVGDKVHGKINWERRYKNMRLHSAGHIVDFAMAALSYSPKLLVPQKADHDKNPHIVYSGILGKNIREELQTKTNALVLEDREFSWYFQPFDQLQKEAIYLQPGLPTDKPLRTLKLEGVGVVADGGTQVKRTSEVGKINIDAIEEKDGSTVVKYSLQ